MTTATDRHQYRALVADVAARAKARLPEAVNGRVEAAARLVVLGDVEPLEDGTIRVNGSDPTRWYHLVGPTCTCKDFVEGRAPESWCKHRIAAGIHKRVQELLPPAVESTQEVHRECTPAPVEMPTGIDPRHIVQIQGKPFVKFAGLLELAHKRGLQALKVDWTYNDAELSLAHAVATFPFGTFEESADATVANVNKTVAPHFRRVALTRAAARALRIALGLEMVSVEELED